MINRVTAYDLILLALPTNLGSNLDTRAQVDNPADTVLPVSPLASVCFYLLLQAAVFLSSSLSPLRGLLPSGPIVFLDRHRVRVLDALVVVLLKTCRNDVAWDRRLRHSPKLLLGQSDCRRQFQRVFP